MTNLNLVMPSVVIAGSVIFAFVPFDRERIRERWAKWVFAAGATIGIVDGATELAWNLAWFELNSEASSQLGGLLSFGRGMFLGLILSLVFSGQLTGKKIENPNRSR